MTQDTTIKIRKESDAVVVQPTTDIDMARSPALQDAIRDLQAERPAKLVIDLSDVGYMDSSGLATLVHAMKGASSYGGKMIVCSLNDKVGAIFQIARLDQYFTISDNVEAALEH